MPLDMMADRLGSITVTCNHHHQKLVDGLWNSFICKRGVDFVVRGGDDRRSVLAHRLLLDVFLSLDKLSTSVAAADDNAPLHYLLEFLYNGQVDVPRAQFGHLMDVAKESDFQMLVEALKEVAWREEDFGEGEDLAPPGSGAVNSTLSPLQQVEPQLMAQAGPCESSQELILPVINTNDSIGEEETLHWATPMVMSEVVATSPPICFDDDNGLRVNKIKVEESVTAEGRGGGDDGKGQTLADRQKKNECPVCGKCFASANYLRIHSRFHSGETPYACDICGRTFESPYTYQGHIRSHARLRPHACLQCGKTFAQRGHLRSHARSHSDRREFECEHCGKKYAYLQVLQRHTRLKHGGATPYECSFPSCDMTFPTN